MQFLSAIFVASLVQAPDPGSPAEILPPPDGLEATPWDDIIVPDCQARLEAAGYGGNELRYSTWNRIKTISKRGQDPLYCHVPQPVRLLRSPSGMTYYGYTFVSCAMAIAMARMEVIAQEEARRAFGRPDDEMPVRAMTHMGTYNCRTLRFKTTQSQHSFGNGLDIAAFQVRGYGEVSVAKNWTARWPAQKKAEDFLRSFAQRLREEQVFTNVLDPDSDAGHWNHIHVDLAPLSDGEPSEALWLLKGMDPPRRRAEGEGDGGDDRAGKPDEEDDSRAGGLDRDGATLVHIVHQQCEGGGY